MGHQLWCILLLWDESRARSSSSRPLAYMYVLAAACRMLCMRMAMHGMYAGWQDSDGAVHGCRPMGSHSNVTHQWCGALKEFDRASCLAFDAVIYYYMYLHKQTRCVHTHGMPTCHCISRCRQRSVCKDVHGVGMRIESRFVGQHCTGGVPCMLRVILGQHCTGGSPACCEYLWLVDCEGVAVLDTACGLRPCGGCKTDAV